MSIFRTPYSDGRVQKYIFNVLCIAIKVIYLSLKQAAARWHHFQKPCLVMDDITYLMVNDIHLLQVNLCQNHLFLHQLTHNMTTDWITSLVHENSKLRTCYVHNFFYSEQFMYTTCSEFGSFIYWTGYSMKILCQIVG